MKINQKQILFSTIAIFVLLMGQVMCESVGNNDSHNVNSPANTPVENLLAIQQTEKEFTTPARCLQQKQPDFTDLPEENRSACDRGLTTKTKQVATEISRSQEVTTPKLENTSAWQLSIWQPKLNSHPISILSFHLPRSFTDNVKTDLKYSEEKAPLPVDQKFRENLFPDMSEDEADNSLGNSGGIYESIEQILGEIKLNSIHLAHEKIDSGDQSEKIVRVHSVVEEKRGEKKTNKLSITKPGKIKTAQISPPSPLNNKKSEQNNALMLKRLKELQTPV